MLTPEYMLTVTNGAENAAAELHNRVIQLIVARIMARLDRDADYILTPIDKYNIQTLQEQGELLKDIKAELVKATGLTAKVIAQAFKEAGVENLKFDNKLYKDVGLPVPETKMSPAVQRAMQRDYEATMHSFENYTRTMASDAQTLYKTECDAAYLNVKSGAMGSQQAVAAAVKNLSEANITAVHYDSGHKDSIEVATARAVRTGIIQSSAQVTLERMKEMGVDLVLTSAHYGARPSHEEWQGQVFHVDWATLDIYAAFTKQDTIPEPETESKYPDFVKSTRYGFVDGLCGANCRHSISPYFEGKKNPYADFDHEKSKEIWQLEQKQRAMERAIRKTKKEKAVYQTAMEKAENESTREAMKAEYKKVTERLKEQNKKYYDFCEENNLRPADNRLSIPKES